MPQKESFNDQDSGREFAALMHLRCWGLPYAMHAAAGVLITVRAQSQQ